MAKHPITGREVTFEQERDEVSEIIRSLDHFVMSPAQYDAAKIRYGAEFMARHTNIVINRPLPAN